MLELARYTLEYAKIAEQSSPDGGRNFRVGDIYIIKK
jgi:hypothetical protein